MFRTTLSIVTLSSSLLTLSCDKRSPVEPTPSIVLDQFVQALRQQGLSVSLGSETPPDVNRVFSVPAHEVRVNQSHLDAFEYATSEAAAAAAAAISPDGQPRPDARLTWVSTPRFYHQDRLIVLYVGCSSEIVQALQTTVGAPVVIGRTPCDLTF
jgi:hypothetical protein